MAGMDPESLTRLLAEHGPRLILYASTFTRWGADVVQEVFVDLSLRQTPPDNLTAWLFGATRNRALHWARSETRLARREKKASRPEATTPLQAAEKKLDAESALAILDTQQREIVVARLWGDLNFDEVGKLVGISAATAWRRYDQALALLKERLASDTQGGKTA